MKRGAPGPFATRLKALREAAGFTQEELATIAGVSVHAVSALERGERRRPHVETVRALSAALDLTATNRDALIVSARAPAHHAAVDELIDVSLPLAPTLLVGREGDMQTLRQFLAAPAGRLVTLIGPGGVGKTRLALEIAHAIAAEGAIRVVFVPLAATQNSGFVASAIAEALGLSDVSAVDLPRRVRVACGDHATLLVLDNFEHVLDAAPVVANLLNAVASLQVLATSRAPLRLRGEQEYAVGPLALGVAADALSAADLARVPAIQLFLNRARDVKPDFCLTSANGSTVAAICRRLDALPLALELAAPWIKVLTAEDLLRRLANDVLLPTAGLRDLPERQQTMNATVAWSYQLLPPNDQRAFRRLGALPGRFSIEAAAAVLAGREDDTAGVDKALGAASGLIDKSLLLRAETSVATRPLFRMLETVRAFAALKLSEAEERDDALAGLVRYCSGEASRAWKGLAGPAQAEWLNRVRDDLENYRGALTWLIEQGRPMEASNMAWELSVFWMIRGHTAEGLQWYERVLALPSIPPAAEAKALYGAALMWYSQAELVHARIALDRTLTLARVHGDRKMLAQASNLSGHVEHAAGNIAVARDRFATSVAGFRELAVPWGIGSALTGMAAGALASGDPGQAERLLDEATSVLRPTGPWFLSLALYVRAILAVRRGSPDEAIAFVRESLTHIRALHDKFAFVYALVPLAAAAVLKGDDAWAARIIGARDAVTERTGATVVDTSVNDLREQAEKDARARLGSERWARAYTAGRTISIDSLLKDIDGAVTG
jgi:predicted ATPase/DNA-binding XRE family transcriptional regulator